MAGKTAELQADEAATGKRPGLQAAEAAAGSGLFVPAAVFGLPAG